MVKNGCTSKGSIGGQLDPRRVTSIGLNVMGTAINTVFRCMGLLIMFLWLQKQSVCK